MKMMSWSRYHCLSWSHLRAERRSRSRLRGMKSRKTRPCGLAAQPRPPVAGVLGRYFQFVIRLFRT